MAQSRLIELSYFDPHTSIRLTTYADTIVTDYSSPNRIISAVRFGGYPEVVKAMSDAIYGGATIDVCSNGETLHLDTVPKGYRRQLSHDGIYAAATLMANDDPQSPDQLKEDAAEDDSTEENKPRKCYIFCPAGDQDRLFEEVDRKTAAPLIPEFRDYVLRELIRRGELRRMEVFSVKEKMDAWVLSLLPEDKNVVQVLEDGLKTGQIAIPGATPGAPDGFAQVENVTSYLSTYGITVADRIRKQFIPLFDPASEPLSDEVLAINRYIQQKAGYSLYDAQLAVAEATKRQLQRCGTALIVAECGSGKTKIGTDALGALYGLGAAQGGKKTFNLVMAPSHVTKKWVREIGETLPNTFAMVVKSITDLNRLYDIPGGVSQAVLEQDLYYRELQAHLTGAMEQFRQQDGDRSAAEALQAAQEQLSSYTKALGQLHAGTPCVNTTDKIPEADIIMLDEIFKCNDGVLNSLLTALNERKYTNEGRTYSIPAVSFFAASNEVPNFNDPQEKILEALYDRLDLKVVTADIAERDNRLAMLRKKQSGTAGNVAATITLDELKAMQREAAALPVPDSVHELADDILCALRENGIRVSDRKYLNYAPVAQAKAWLSGHAAVMPEDLLALKNYLWDAPQDRETVEQTLRRMCINPMQDKANNILAMALEAQDEFDEIRTGSDDPNVGRKAFIKLRGELIRLYGMQQQLAASTQGPNEAAVTDKLLEELEQSSRQAHEAVGFTYIPLEQQAALQ